MVDTTGMLDPFNKLYGLYPPFVEKVKTLLKMAEERGLPVKITSGYRPKNLQDELYAQGRTTPGPIITNAKGSDYASMHQWFLACDFCRNIKNREFDDFDGFFAQVGGLAETLGLEWGGNWKLVDKPHLQMRGLGTITELKSKYQVPENFKKTWSN